MTPYQIAEQWCADHPGVMPFAEQLAHYGRHGFIWSSPTAFILASYHHSTDEWYIGVAAGDIREFLPHAPWPAQWISFHRGERLARWPWKRLFSRLTRGNSIPESIHGRISKETRPAATLARSRAG